MSETMEPPSLALGTIGVTGPGLGFSSSIAIEGKLGMPASHSTPYSNPQSKNNN